MDSRYRYARLNETSESRSDNIAATGAGVLLGVMGILVGFGFVFMILGNPSSLGTTPDIVSTTVPQGDSGGGVYITPGHPGFSLIPTPGGIYFGD